MYPNLYYALLDLFGWELPALKLINSFGLFVALAFLAAHGLLGRELKRHAALGNFKAQTSTEVVGHAPNPIDTTVILTRSTYRQSYLSRRLLRMQRRALAVYEGISDPTLDQKIARNHPRHPCFSHFGLF